MAAKIAKAAPAKAAGSTSGAGGDKSATRTASNTRTATATRTATSTEAYTQGNITVTGGAGKGATIVHIGGQPTKPTAKTGTSKVGTVTPKGKAKAVDSLPRASGSGSSHTSQK